MEGILKKAREIDALVKYAKCEAKTALDLKTEDEPVADMHMAHSKEAMQAVQRKHSEVVSMIETYKREHGEPPAGMFKMYEYVHERHTEAAQEVTDLQEKYKLAK